MVGRRGRPPKRKMEELQEDHDGKAKSAKEARIEAISLDASEPAHIALSTLTSETWQDNDDSEEWCEDHASHVSEAEEGKEGTQSQGTCWRGIPDPLPSQVVLSCKRVASGEAFDCETQTFHFTSVSTSKVVVVPDSDTPETIKVEIDTDQQEEFVSHPLVCCVEGCETSSDTDTTATFYTVPKGREKALWAETLDIVPCSEGDSRQHVCSKHFITPTKLLTTGKGKTRKKKTCDMLVAEEAEKIRQGLSSGRPKRTPKPNKNYDWAEIVPLIKAEPDDLENELYLSTTSEKTGSTAATPRKQLLSSFKEDKENKKPYSDTEKENLQLDEEEEEEEEEDDLENISLPSHPRPPPPKPKGRPHRIRDSGTQTESAYRTLGPRQPLREVKVQCNINSEAPSPCTSCSYVNWLRLEELLVDCATKLEGDLCVPEVQECLRKMVDNVPHPTHATNVLKLLSGDGRDALENTSDIILVPSQEDEVEIENVIHTTVEEPITGVREITPKTWQKKAKWKKALTPVNYVGKEEEEEDPLDGLGIKEATEMDDDEFQPNYLEGEETEEDEHGLDDEDWTMNKSDRDSRSAAKKKPKKTPPQSKVKKEPGDAFESGEVSCWHCKKEFADIAVLHSHRCRGRFNSRTSDRRFLCNQCGKTFTQKISLQYHNIYVHNGERKAACPHCDYRAPDKAKLSVHLRTHSKLRPYVCELCKASFKFRSTYRSHVARHTNSGNFVCNQCNKAFTMASELREHRRIHGQERPFVCPLCAMTFKQKKQLRVHHRAVHLRDKRYVCEVCGSCHINNWNLRAHMKTHVRTDSSFASCCKLCGSEFRGRAGLAAHMRLRHGGQFGQHDPQEEWEEDEDEEEDKLSEKYKMVLSLASREAIEHVIEPHQKQEVKMIEVYSCSCCGQLCESLEQLRAHSFSEH